MIRRICIALILTVAFLGLGAEADDRYKQSRTSAPE